MRKQLGREMVGVLDRAYGNPMFRKVDRKKLRGLICGLAGDLIEGGDCDDLKPLYNRYSGCDFDAEAAGARDGGSAGSGVWESDVPQGGPEEAARADLWAGRGLDRGR